MEGIELKLRAAVQQNAVVQPHVLIAAADYIARQSKRIAELEAAVNAIRQDFQKARVFDDPSDPG